MKDYRRRTRLGLTPFPHNASLDVDSPSEAKKAKPRLGGTAPVTTALHTAGLSPPPVLVSALEFKHYTSERSHSAGRLTRGAGRLTRGAPPALWYAPPPPRWTGAPALILFCDILPVSATSIYHDRSIQTLALFSVVLYLFL
ncbi:hypothetical protein EYF80_064372 [Liparis tanakae]|uniref:Uncharacterized protein n=1 Tax=Liparis tanakae TaxID=230148 RepID=A0A4Z2E9K4_9TELE|nr:hypothetical protein EYF80_064372 [Liparis tanakae]